jgi:tripartite-type tricarboxylate transporter receptor subunit TctC
VVVRNDFPAATLKDFIAYAKANPGKISYASAGSGSATHLACELLKQKADIDMLHVPYRGTGPALNDLVSGKVDMMCDQGLNVGAQLKAANVRALAIAQDIRSTAFPAVPTTREAGLDGFIVNASTAMYAPKGTPPAVIKALSEALFTAARTDLIKQRLEQLVSEAPSGNRMSPEGLKSFTATEHTKWTEAIKSGGIKIN